MFCMPVLHSVLFEAVNAGPLSLRCTLSPAGIRRVVARIRSCSKMSRKSRSIVSGADGSFSVQ